MMTDKQMQMMDHLSEPGRATIKHHLVTHVTRWRADIQPAVRKQNNNNYPLFLFSSANVVISEFLPWLNKPQSYQVQSTAEYISEWSS